MNSVKGKIIKLILGFASIGMFFFLIFPASLSASHFRYGTMSWDKPWDNGTILLKMQNGWRTAYNNVLNSIGTITTGWVNINWGDGSAAESVQIKNIAVDSSEGSTLTEIGSNSTGTWETGVYHTYTDNGTYIISWTSTARISDIENMADNSAWRLETKVNIGG